MAKRTLKTVERELKRARRAQKRLQKDLNFVMKQIAIEGGLESPSDAKVKCNPNLRRLREVQKSLDTLAKIEKSLTVEIGSLEQTARQEAEESAYALG